MAVQYIKLGVAKKMFSINDITEFWPWSFVVWWLCSERIVATATEENTRIIWGSRKDWAFTATWRLLVWKHWWKWGRTRYSWHKLVCVCVCVCVFLMLWQLKAHIRIEDQNDGHWRQIIFIEAHWHYSVSNSYYSHIPLVIFDPASFYGHHEFDLAGATLFGGFTREFFDAYHRLIPKAPGFGGRQKLYQLFHCLCVW